MNTIILVLFGIVWSAISGAIGSVITWEARARRDRGQSVVRAAKGAKLSAELTDAHNLIAHLKTDYAALQTQHRALILHTDNLAARIADDDEAIAALQAQLVVAEAAQSKPDEAVYFVAPDAQEKIGGAKPKRPRATKIKAVENSTL